MNSAIASNINNVGSLNQQVANGSRSSLLLSSIDFAVTECKKNFSAPCNQGKYLYKLSAKEELFNGQRNPCSEVDQNKNNLGNGYNSMNGNKDKSDDGIEVPKIQLYTGKIHIDWKQVHKIGAGLNNLGNSCFMNTVIQCLTYCPPLANYLLHDNDHPSKCSVTGFCMMCLLQKHMKRAIGKSGESIKPFDIYHRLKLIAKHFQHGRQEDAHEFLRFVIDGLVQSCLAQKNVCSKLDPASKETTIINQIFGGYHRSQVTCLRCKAKSNKYDHFMEILVDVKQNVMSLEKALEKSIQPELLHQDNSYSCPKCKTSVPAQKKYTVYRAPNVATFQLKRFDYNRSFGGKIVKHISYPEKLNMRPFMSETKGEPVLYRLNAVLVHTGASCNSGHYYCYVKNSNGFWYIMDDQRVNQVSLNQVLNQGAYILFYVKMEPAEGPFTKKCLENKNSIVKGSISTPNCKKVLEISSAKPSPLSEVNHIVSSNSPAKVSVYPLSNANKQMSFSPDIQKERNISPNQKDRNFSPNQKDRNFSPSQKDRNFSPKNKDHVSFSVRSTNSPGLHSLSGTINAVDNKVKASPNNSSASSSCGLVPYIQDSSESSDDNDSSQPANIKSGKTEIVSSRNETKDTGAKPVAFKQTSFESSLPFQSKVKRSKSIFILNSSPSTSSTSPKVIASGSWTVTEAPNVVSPVRSSSSNSVNSTTDWHVTCTVVESPVKKTTTNNLITSVNSKEINNRINLGTVSDAGTTAKKSEYTMSKYSEKHQYVPIRENSTSHQAATSDEYNVIPNERTSPAQKCDFRNQFSESESSFSKNTKNDREHSSSFLKRKCSESDPKTFEDFNFSYNESRYISLSKKTKYSEEFAEKELGSTNTNYKLNTKFSACERNQSKHESTPHKSAPTIKHFMEQQNGTAKVHSDKLMKTHVNNESNKRSDSDSESNSSSNSSSSNSKLEYEWVEKPKDNFKSNSSSPSKGKLIKNNFYSSPSKSQVNVKSNAATELTQNSSSIYGAAVPTWKNDNLYRESMKYESRKVYDDYDDEFDRGKVRKSKPKDRYQHYPNYNPFQKYAERYHGPSKFNNKFHYNRYYYRKPYTPHHQWKRNHNDNFQRQHKKYYGRHF